MLVLGSATALTNGFKVAGSDSDWLASMGAAAGAGMVLLALPDLLVDRLSWAVAALKGFTAVMLLMACGWLLWKAAMSAYGSLL